MVSRQLVGVLPVVGSRDRGATRREARPHPEAPYRAAGRQLEAAIHGAAQPLMALAGAYRRFALDHPHLYRLMTDRPLPRERLPAGLEERAAAPVLRAVGDPDRARAVWAFAHGMVALELAQRFPPGTDLEPAWRAGITALG
jgi:Tetracyclin repressor-like, C-terminal domain